ncbi:hypothetical protein [Limnohabitans sp.]|uniref:hypothetical protein n=1 Tax=Limnohabitans sp. TaxID=1907725 RepID=UPI0033411287
MTDQLDLTSFIKLKTSMTGTVDSDTTQRIEVACQSIHKWLKYCEYHYSNLPDVQNLGHLMLAGCATEYRRRGESVDYRYVCEANIIGFLNCLHALLDSFPYLLNLVFPRFSDPDNRVIGWSENFVEKYSVDAFYGSLKKFMLGKTFNVVKSYVNTTKHKHLILIAINQRGLEFDEFNARLPFEDENGEIQRKDEIIPRQDAIKFIGDCHDDLIPEFFELCRTITTPTEDRNSVTQ